MKQLLGFILIPLLLVGPVSAHSPLERTEPKDGQSLSASPAEIRMWFGESIKAGLSTFKVLDFSGKQVDKHDLRADEKESGLVRLSLAEKLPAGTYKVTWSAVAQDMHVGKGSFSFKIAP
ncbi:MAG: copper resistance CopC family protein [Chthoniobacterales bacterium]